jgi:hypothetical protein
VSLIVVMGYRLIVVVPDDPFAVSALGTHARLMFSRQGDELCRAELTDESAVSETHLYFTMTQT